MKTIKNSVEKSNCEKCKLYQKCNYPKLKYIGNLKHNNGILVLLESPTKQADETGILVSDSLKAFLKKAGLDSENVVFASAIQCYSAKYTEVNIRYCRERIQLIIDRMKPKVILTLGDIAAKSVLGQMGSRLKGIKTETYRHKRIPLYDLNCWLISTFPIWEVQAKTEKDRNYWKIFQQDINQVQQIANTERKLPKKLNQNVKIIIDIENAILAIEYFLCANNPVAFDYETTGIKPHAKEHKVHSIALSDGRETAAFPNFQDIQFQNAWRKFLTSDAQKIAHKLDFEEMWSVNCFNQSVKNWYWDTCLGAHVLKNKQLVGLKYHTFIEFGVVGYDEDVDRFLKSNEEYGANSKNNIEQAPLEKMLLYNGLDAFYTWQLWNEQKKKMDEEKQGFDFFMQGTQTLAKITQNGFRIDVEKMRKVRVELTEKIESILQEIKQCEECQIWKISELNTRRDELSIDSNLQLSKLLYLILKYPEPEKGKPKTDEEQLSKIGTIFTKKIIEYRKLKKIRDTYFFQFEREQVDGVVRPFFNLHLVQTYRSSSNNPNLQNIPKRDEMAKKYIRSLIIPRLGNKLIEYDYKAVEVCVGACYHKDRNMIKYIENPENDMHRDTAADIFKVEREEVSKDMRFVAKNGFVFAAFYGSSAMNIAPNIWDMLKNDSKTLEILKKHGVKTFSKFQKHIEKVHEIFWNDRFPEYMQWKRRIWKQYQETGCIDSYTGFRYHTPMTWTEVTNYPIQGSAFHCLLYLLNKIQPELENPEKFQKTKLIGQIHDASIFDVFPSEEHKLDRLVRYYGTKKIRDDWKWLIVPLTIEKEVGEIDGDWTTLKGEK